MLVLWMVLSPFAIAQETPFFSEFFDGVTPPILPFGWVDESGEWESSSSVASNGSGGNNVTVSGSQQASLRTPSLNLSGLTGGTIEYLARRTSTYVQDSLIVLASINGGADFGITLLARGEALPATDGSYEMIAMAVPPELLGEANVVLQFVALGGSTAGSNIRIDDVQILGEGDPTAGNSIFGFSEGSSQLDPATGLVDVPVYLDFENVEPLQGVQATISWDVAELTVNDVLPGPAVANAAEWQLSFNIQGSSATVVLLGSDSNSLIENVYDPLFTFQLTLVTPTTSMQSILSLDSAIGALAVPTGDDVGLILGQSTHTITLDPGDAIFSPDVTELNAGTVDVDASAPSILTVTNTGNTDLQIDSIAVSNPLYSVSPESIVVLPGEQQEFTVTFTPSFTAFGTQSGTLTFFHNAVGGSDDISVTGFGIGGRGDASRDGAVDVLDLVLGIDYILEAALPDPEQTSSVDLFPFGSSDGQLDVRDLTVLSQAILLDRWPDDIPLPLATAANSSNKGDENEVRLHADFSPGGGTLIMSNSVPVRGLQVSLFIDSPTELPVLPVTLDPSITTQWIYDAWTSELRIVAVRMDGGVLDPGHYPMLDLPGYSNQQPMELRAGKAVVPGPESQAVVWVDGEDTSLGENEGIGEDLIGSPYPNPFARFHSSDLLVPLVLSEVQHVQADIFNLLGQQVSRIIDTTLPAGEHVLTWNGLDQQRNKVAPGMYLIRIQQGNRSLTRSVLVR